jgi:DNA transformation protein and related proteins
LAASLAKNGFLQFLLDQPGSIDDVVSRAMFGGVGLYAGSVFFAIDKPYADRPMTMQYFEVPANVLESAEQLTKWARRAIAVAERKRASS